MKLKLDFYVMATRRTYPVWYWETLVPILGDNDLWNDAGVWIDEIVMFKN